MVTIAGNISNEDDEGPDLPATTIANSTQEDDERFGVGRGGTGNFKRPPPASRYLHGSWGDGTKSNATFGSASSRRQSDVSGTRPYSPSRPSVASFATGRSIQPIPHTTVHPITEATMPSSTAMAQFQFDFEGSEHDRGGNVDQRSRSSSKGSGLELQNLSLQQQQAEQYQDYQHRQHHHPLQTQSAPESNSTNKEEFSRTTSVLASAPTTGKSSSAIVSNATPIELTALPQVQYTSPSPYMVPVPIQSSCSSTSLSNSPPSGTAAPVQAAVPPSAIAQEERFVYGRGGFANISKDSDGSGRQHRNLVDYLASKRKKNSDSTSDRNNDPGHGNGKDSTGEAKKKGWWRTGKHSHHHTGIAGVGRQKAELQPTHVTAE